MLAWVIFINLAFYYDLLLEKCDMVLTLLSLLSTEFFTVFSK
jgi:hypothetical protein